MANRKCFFNAEHTGIVSYPVSCTDGLRHYVCYDCQEYVPCDNDNRLDVNFKKTMKNGKFYSFDIRDLYTESNLCSDIEMQLSQEEYEVFNGILQAILSYIPRDIKLIVHNSPYPTFDGFYDYDEHFIMFGSDCYEYRYEGNYISYSDVVTQQGYKAGYASKDGIKSLSCSEYDGKGLAHDMSIYGKYADDYARGYVLGLDVKHHVIFRYGDYYEIEVKRGKNKNNGSDVTVAECKQIDTIKLYRVEWSDNRGNYKNKVFNSWEYDDCKKASYALFDELTTPDQDDTDNNSNVDNTATSASTEVDAEQTSLHMPEEASNEASRKIARSALNGFSTLLFALLIAVASFCLIQSLSMPQTSYAATCTVHKYAHKAGYYSRSWGHTVFYATPPSGCTVYNGATDSSSSVTPTMPASTPITTPTSVTSQPGKKSHKAHSSAKKPTPGSKATVKHTTGKQHVPGCTFDIATNGTHQRSCNGVHITIDVHVKRHHS